MRHILSILLLAGCAVGCANPPEHKRPGVMVLRSVATSQSDMTTIVVRKDQSVTVNGQSVTAGGLPQKLEAMGIKTTNPIFLQPEPGTPYSAVAKVVQLLQAAGYTNLAVVNNKPSGKKK